MKPLLFAICAMLAYAVANVIYDLKFPKANSFLVMATWYAVMLPLALAGLGVMKVTGQAITLPTREQLPFVIVVAIVFVVADGFFTGAYAAGGSLMTITTITVMFPAFAAVIKYYVDGNTPNRYQVASYLFIIVAVLLAIKGSTAIQQPK